MDFFDTLIAQLKNAAEKNNSFTVAPETWEVFIDPSKAVRQTENKTVEKSAEIMVDAPTQTEKTESFSEFELEKLQANILECRDCPLAEIRQNPALSYGNTHAKLMIVIENPSLADDENGRIFSGEVGVLLDKMLLAMGLKREETYITSIVKCRTPGNRPPSENEVKSCRMKFFDHEVKVVKPECILAFGAGFAKNILHREGSISTLRGNFDSYEGIPVMSTFNPAYLLRQPSAKKVVWGDLQMVMKALGL